jgi:hypothetical protein
MRLEQNSKAPEQAPGDKFDKIVHSGARLATLNRCRDVYI